MAWARGSTRASRLLRADTLRRYPRCYLRFDGCTIVSTEDDHRTPLSEGGSDTDPGNHAGACSHCHGIKSRREATRAARRARAIAKHPIEVHPALRTPRRGAGTPPRG